MSRPSTSIWDLVNRTAPFLAALVLLCLQFFPLLALCQEDQKEDEEEIIFFEDEEQKRVPSRSLLEGPEKEPYERKVKIGGYWDNEMAVDTYQENGDEDMIDLRSKIFGYGTYGFSGDTSLYLSVWALAWMQEGGNDRQQIDFDLYEAYMNFKFEHADLKIGKILVKWGACDLFAPTNGINPVNYRIFIDPRTEDLKIPLPMVKADFYAEDLTVETLYIPIFQSAIFDLAGADLGLLKQEDLPDNVPDEFNSLLNRDYQWIPIEKVDYQEQMVAFGEAALKLAYRQESSVVELVYFYSREDFPHIKYKEPENLEGSTAVEGEVTDAQFELQFQRYELYGITYKTHLKGVDLRAEYAYSPGRTMSMWLDSDEDAAFDETVKVRRPWQAASIELDHLDSSGKYFIKVGAERITYFSAPRDLVYQNDDSIYFVALLRMYAMNDSLIPEWRVINMQTEENNWFISPRVTYKFKDRYSVTAGLNIFAGGNGDSQTSGQEFSPIAVFSDNNQAWVSVRWRF